MLPSSAIDNAIERRPFDTVLTHQGGCLTVLASPPSTNLKDLCGGEFGVTVALPMRTTATSRVSIGSVIGITSKLQMVRTNASRHVTLMPDKHILRDGAVLHLIAKAMGARGGIPELHAPITELILTALPKPTGLSLYDLRPKTSVTLLSNRFKVAGKAFGCIIRLHLDLLRRGVGPRTLARYEGFAMPNYTSSRYGVQA